MAEFGLRTRVGNLTRSDQTYNPRTVFPDPGGATMSNSFESFSKSLRIIPEDATWDGLSLPEKAIFPKSETILLHSTIVS